MMIQWWTLAVALAALVVAVIALYRATHTERKIQVIPAPCTHKWEIYHSSDRMDRWGRCVGYAHTLKCVHCGDLLARHISINERYRTEH